MPKILPDTFEAWINKQPGATGAFHVKGRAEVPTSGWKGTLRTVEPGGINDRIAILEASFNEPDGIVNDVISKILLEFTEVPAAKPYTQATIRYDGDEITIDVTEAQ